jgi:hypothetical protein
MLSLRQSTCVISISQYITFRRRCQIKKTFFTFSPSRISHFAASNVTIYSHIKMQIKKTNPLDINLVGDLNTVSGYQVKLIGSMFLNNRISQGRVQAARFSLFKTKSLS